MRRSVVVLALVLCFALAVPVGAVTCDEPDSDGQPCDDGLFCTTGETCSAGVCGGGTPIDCSAAGDQCNDGICDEDADACVAAPKPDTSPCDDGLFCTTGEVCTAGVCGGGTPIDCSAAGDQCNDGVCDEAADACVAAPKAGTPPCDDGLFCTTGEVCTAGVCGGGAPRDCGNDGECNINICDETLDLCLAVPKLGNPPCDDGLFCTVDDACNLGQCSGAPIDCSAAGDQCNDGVCDEAADACVAAPKPDTSPCDDGQFCTTGEVCTAGVCGGGTPIDCSAAGDQCNDGVCDEDADACVAAPKPDTSPCDDGQFCTTGEVCTAGVCGGGTPIDCSAAGDQCNDGVCDEDADACVPAPKPDTSPCDDGQFCTTGEVCTAGVCGGGTPIDCSAAGDQCNDGVCDEAADACVPAPKPDTSPCDDGQFCTTGEVCTAGVCGGGAPTDCSAAGDQCNDGVCDEAADACVAAPKPDTSPCDDGQFCTTGEVCTAGVCGGGTPTDCSAAGDQCNDGVCDEAADACVPAPKAGTPPCDDGQFCTTGEVCTAGVCGGGTARDCSAVGDPCNDGICDETADACVPTPRAGTPACDDGLRCTTGDTCQAGTCGGTPVDCSAFGDQCNDGVCDPETGACVAVPKAGTPPCDDGLFCTTGEVCSAGVCGGGAPIDCSAAGDQCNDGVCDEAADACVAAPKPDTSPCDDGQFCTTGEVCTAGVCGGGAPTDCSAAGDQCNDGTCDEAADACVATPKPGTPPCDDGQFCTTGEVCTAGVCGGGAPRDCSAAGDQCNDGTCDDTADACVKTPKPGTPACDDGQFCTTGEVCTAGVCGGGTPIDCSAAGDQCNDGVCDDAADACVKTPKPGTPPCDDGQFCTTGEVCTAGVCGGGGPRDCSAAGDQCNDGTCDETADACVAAPKPGTPPCDDGQFCTTGEVCTAGVCGGGAPRDCSAAGDQCNDGTCDEAADACVPAPKPGTPPCDDGLFCNGADTCAGGGCSVHTGDPCAGEPACNDVCDETNDTCLAPAGVSCPDDGNVCTDDVCDGAGQCLHPNNTAPCDDGSFCNGPDTCADGTCSVHAGDPCAGGPACNNVCNETNDNCLVTAGTPCADDGNQCTDDRCDGAGACAHPERLPGSECDDHDVCTTRDICLQAECGGARIPGCCNEDDECDDGFACTEDRCTDHACTYVPLDARCGDGPDCQAAACAPTEAGADADGCVLRAANETGYCSEDRNPCTVDLCRAGTCAHEDDASGPRCPDLTDPYLTLVALLDRTTDIRTLLTEAEKTGCPTMAAGCQIVGGVRSPVPRLAEFLDGVRADLDAAATTLAGRVGPPIGANRDPVVRARLSRALIAPTRGRLRTFRLTVGQLRRQKLVGRAFAKQLQKDARTLLRGANRVHKRLRRITMRRETFAR